MNLDLNDDQEMLKASLERLLAERYQPEQRRGYAAQDGGWSRERWADFAELGLLALPFGEGDGGLGLGPVETMIVGEAFGRALVLEPYLAAIVLAGTAIGCGGSNEQRAVLLPGLLDGSTLYAYAHDAQVVAEPSGRDWRLSGTISLVIAGNSADRIVVPTPAGIFIVSADAISRRGYRLHGGGGAADAVLDRLHVATSDRLAGDCAPERVIEAGIAFLAAEAAGAMQAALDITLDHLRTREQFGRPIGTNQALRHRAADMLVEVEQARSAAILAALLSGATDPLERARGFAAVKAVIGAAARFVAQQAVQLHGGIGVSEEHVVSHYFRRLTAIGMLLGDSDHHLDRLAAMGGFTAGDGEVE